MFHNTYQAGFLSILYSIGSKPLQIWDSQVQSGHAKRITDEDIQSSVLEIVGTNVSTNFIHCPADPKKCLGIRLPYLVIILKNLNTYFTFEVQVLDDKNVRRRFRASTFQSCTRVKPFICTMPMVLDEGWNQIQFNLADFTRRAYGTNYVETLRVQVHANCRLRRIYFSDRLYPEEELPPDFKVFLPIRQPAGAREPRALAAFPASPMRAGSTKTAAHAKPKPPTTLAKAQHTEGSKEVDEERAADQTAKAAAIEAEQQADAVIAATPSLLTLDATVLPEASLAAPAVASAIDTGAITATTTATSMIAPAPEALVQAEEPVGDVLAHAPALEAALEAEPAAVNITDAAPKDAVDMPEGSVGAA